MNSQENRDRLAREVKVARLRKFKTVDRARIEAKVSRGTWDSVERAEPVKEFSLAAIEEALDWPAGYALSILEGETQRSTVRGPGRLSALIEEFAQMNPHVTNAEIAKSVGVGKSTVTRWRDHALTELPQDQEPLHRLAELIGVPDAEVFYAVGIDTSWIIERVVDAAADPPA